MARFDPAQEPPVVPTPNDLAQDPKTGLITVAAPKGASGADQEFAAWLSTLNGFPASSTGSATFTGKIDPASLGTQSVRVLDATENFAPVEGVTLALGEPAPTDGSDAQARLSVTPPAGGWKPGHSYALAIIGGANGLKGEGGKPLVGSTTWTLIRSEHSLVTCEDLSSPNCQSATEIIPSDVIDPAGRVRDQAKKAKQLELLRRKYKPAIDALIASGVNRTDIALLWTFKVHDGPIALFNPAATPPQVPLPNDLAIDPTTGLVNAPIDPNAPAAQQEFTRDYLNTLDGFPVSANADATIVGGALDATTVNEQTVKVIDLTLADGEAPVVPTLSYDPGAGTIRVSPPQSGWIKGHRYAVVLTSEIHAADGTPLAAGDVWALARSSTPLVTCADLASTDCASTVSLAPISLEQARALEGLRRQYQPVLDALEAKGIERRKVSLLWTFRIVSFAEATFDPANSVIPFPNNLLLDSTQNRVKLPVPPNAPPLQQMLIAGLNTLDGFSTTGPFVTENSATRGAIDQGKLDAATLAAGTGFLSLTPGTTEPHVHTCLNCQSSTLPNGQIPDAPQQLQFVTDVPLDSHATYAAYLTDALKDERGKKIVASPVFALVRLANPLVDANGNSLVSGVANEDAMKLEPLRQGLKPLLDALTAQGVERKHVALAWAFTTQSVKKPLEDLHDLPTLLGSTGMLPSTPVFAVDATATVKAGLPPTLPQDKIGQIFVGEIPTAYLLTGPGTTLNPGMPQIQRIPFTLILPDPAKVTPPANGWPITIFGHGLTGHRNQVLAFANSLNAAGQAVIAIDHVFHGDRSVCTGSKAVTGAPSDDFACADPTTQMCGPSGRCVARNPATRADCSAAATGGVPGDLYCSLAGQGACLADQKCEGGDFLRQNGAVAISGNGFLDTVNLFATRDHFRAPVVDLAQLERVLRETTAPGNLNQLLQAQGANKLDGTHIRYAGQSLGGIIGSMFTASSPHLERSVLNVPGADLAEVMMTAPAFSAQKNAFLGMLASQGITQGTPRFDEFMGIAKWILGPSDPQNAGYWMLNSQRAPMSRKVLIQYIQGDLVIPNPTTELLIASTNRDTGAVSSVFKFNPSLMAVPPADRHGFLLNFKDPATTLTAQMQAATFLNTGSIQ